MLDDLNVSNARRAQDGGGGFRPVYPARVGNLLYLANMPLTRAAATSEIMRVPPIKSMANNINVSPFWNSTENEAQSCALSNKTGHLSPDAVKEKMVRARGFEPPRSYPLEPESSASASFATRAFL